MTKTVTPRKDITMTDDAMLLSRRRFLQGAGAAVALGVAPSFWRQAAIAGTEPPEQVNLQFGADAEREMVVSWSKPASVKAPSVRFGPKGEIGRTVGAYTIPY